MKRIGAESRARSFASLFLLFGLARFGSAGPAQAQGPQLFGYDASDDHLVRFSASAPSVLLDDVALTGLGAGESLIGLDVRPATGELFAVALQGTAGRVVSIDPASGAITPISATPVTLSPGDFFGMSFNPVVDRIRIVSDAALNLRLNPNNGALAAVDVSLAYAAGDSGEGIAPNVEDVAYTNSEAGALTTTVFGIDVGRDVLVRLGSVDGTPVSPNTGQLTTIGALGVNATSYGGFDIDAGTGTAYAALRVGGVSELYTINLTTGAATLVGAIGGATTIDGLAVPEPGSLLGGLCALGALRVVRRQRAFSR